MRRAQLCCLCMCVCVQPALLHMTPYIGSVCSNIAFSVSALLWLPEARYVLLATDMSTIDGINLVV